MINHNLIKWIIRNSYDYEDDYDYEEDILDTSINTQNNQNDSSQADSATDEGNRSAQELKKINSASSILGLNILLTPDLLNYYGDFKQSNTEGFRVRVLKLY